MWQIPIVMCSSTISPTHWMIHNDHMPISSTKPNPAISQKRLKLLGDIWISYIYIYCTYIYILYIYIYYIVYYIYYIVLYIIYIRIYTYNIYIYLRKNIIENDDNILPCTEREKPTASATCRSRSLAFL